MFRVFKELWQLLTPLDRKKLTYVFILVLVMACVEALGVISIMPFLAVLSSPDIVEKNKFLTILYDFLSVHNDQDFIVYLGFISLFIVIVSAMIKIITSYALNRFGSLQRHYFSTRLLKIYLKQKYEFFIQRNSATLVKNVLSETDQLVGNLIQPALTICSYSIIICAMIIILLVFDPIMAVLTAFSLFFFYSIIFWAVRKKLAEIGKSFTKANTERFQSCHEVLGGIKDVIVNNAQLGYFERFDKNSRLFAQHIATRDTLGQVPLQIVETVGYGCLIILAISLVISGREVSHILPVLGLYGFAAYRMLPAAQNIYRSISTLKFAQHVFKNIKQEFELEKKLNTEIATVENIKFNHYIRLENIAFSYSNRDDKFVLQNFNLVIPKNSSLGIVGKSGSGKSTLIDLMLGLLEPTDGKLMIDHQILTQANLSAWHQLVGYVPQSIYLADKTIAENIAFGFAKDEIIMSDVILAAKQAQLHDFILENLPNGYDTVVGERGVLLSGGQKQRVGIARALYKKPEVLFMDEATSALDVETEQAVNEAIQKLSGKKTLIIIAHRHSAIEKCDRLISLN